MAIVYKHLKKNTKDLFYIGIGKNKQRAYSKESRNDKWHEIVNEYDFDVEIIYENLTKDEAAEIEKQLISKYGRIGFEEDGILVNIHSGGYGGWDHIDTKGENNPMYEKSVKDIFIQKYGKQEGLRMYKESRLNAGKKTSKKLKGIKKTEEHRQNLSKAKLEFFKNETLEEKEQRKAYISEYMKAANIVRSEEYKAKMSESLKAKSAQIHKKVECPHCGKLMNKGNLKRWHGENCKQR